MLLFLSANLSLIFCIRCIRAPTYKKYIIFPSSKLTPSLLHEFDIILHIPMTYTKNVCLVKQFTLSVLFILFGTFRSMKNCIRINLWCFFPCPSIMWWFFINRIVIHTALYLHGWQYARTKRFFMMRHRRWRNILNLMYIMQW